MSWSLSDGRKWALGAVALKPSPPAPAITLTKSVNPSGTQPPGTDLVYAVAFTNGGGQAAQVFIVIDPIPANIDFKLGSPSTDLGTTGMTVAVQFSNDNAATWTYTPVSGGGGALAGYDRAVTHVRWLFTGNLSQSSPNNTGSIGLTAKIRSGGLGGKRTKNNLEDFLSTRFVLGVDDGVVKFDYDTRPTKLGMFTIFYPPYYLGEVKKEKSMRGIPVEHAR